jgi:hypothetical protein
MDAFELGMEGADPQDDVFARGARLVGAIHPIRHQVGHLWPLGRTHAVWERQDVVDPKAPGSFLWAKVVRGNVLPHRADEQFVDVTKLGQIDRGGRLSARPMGDGVRVDPLGSARVGGHLQVGGHSLTSESNVVIQEGGHLGLGQRIALDGRGPMCVLDP